MPINRGRDKEDVVYVHRASHMALVIKNPPANAGHIRVVDLIPGLGRSLGGGHGNPF